jgi:hypothetical protein
MARESRRPRRWLKDKHPSLRSAWQEGTRSGGSATRVLTGLKIAYRTLRPLVVEWPGVPPAPRRADAFSLTCAWARP